MLIYWVLFLVPAMAAMALPSIFQDLEGRRALANETFGALMWWGLGACFALAIGLRFQVGADWDSYDAQFLHAAGLEFFEVFYQVDPGYVFFNWLSARLGYGLTGANLLSASVFVIGLFAFCRTMPRPWLALGIAVPYLVVVVAMGYTRQSVAIGIVLIAMTCLTRQRPFAFLGYLIIASLFHRTALIMAPLAVVSLDRKRVWSTTAAVGFVGLGAYAVLNEAFRALYQNYIVAGYESEGAVVRLLMCALPATLFLLRGKRFRFSSTESTVWRLVSWASIGLLLALGLGPYTTAIDRIGLYLLPVQIVVFSRFPDAFGRFGGNNDGAVFGVLGYYGIVLFTWLNFAAHASWWVPYQSVITD